MVPGRHFPGRKIYAYSNCDTCRRAVKWLRAREIEFHELPIGETPPSLAELRAMLKAHGGELKRLFNTSGRDYRELKLGEKLGSLSEDEAFALLSRNGNLVKRPFVLGPSVGLVGFDEETWKRVLKASR